MTISDQDAARLLAERKDQEAETVDIYPRCTSCGHSGAFHHPDEEGGDECAVLRCFCMTYTIGGRTAEVAAAAN